MTTTHDRIALEHQFRALPDDARIDDKMLSAVLFCSVRKIQKDRLAGVGPAYIRSGGRAVTDRNGNTRIHGSRVFYLKRDVLEYLETKNQRITKTAQIAEAA